MPTILRVSANVCTFVLLWSICSSCQQSPEASADTWPTSPPEEQGFDSAVLAQVVEQIDAQDLPVDSLQVVRNGVLIMTHTSTACDRPHDIASSPERDLDTGRYCGHRGLLSLDQGVMTGRPRPVLPTDEKADIELRHLLTMTSGLDCGRGPGERELFEMMASEDYVRYALELPSVVPPGAEFAYCSPGSHVLSAMISRAAGANALAFARDNLFGPLGIQSAIWPADPQGVTHGWGDLQLHPRDMARIGQLF
jgi:hypothetical protein